MTRRYLTTVLVGLSLVLMLTVAINAAVGAGKHPDCAIAVAAMTRIGETFEPNAQIHARYNELYFGVYKNMYKQLRPLYKIISKH